MENKLNVNNPYLTLQQQKAVLEIIVKELKKLEPNICILDTKAEIDGTFLIVTNGLHEKAVHYLTNKINIITILPYGYRLETWFTLKVAMQVFISMHKKV